MVIWWLWALSDLELKVLEVAKLLYRVSYSLILAVTGLGTIYLFVINLFKLDLKKNQIHNKNRFLLWFLCLVKE